MRTPKEIAEFLIVGYVQCWSLSKLAAIAGADPRNEFDIAELHKTAPFLSGNVWRYFKATPVRAFVETQYPKLARYLDANRKEPAKLLACAPQVARLVCDETKASERFTGAERKERSDVMRDAYRVNAANAVARSIQESTQRGAWNVCKA